VGGYPVLDFLAGPDVATEEGGDGLGEVGADRELAEAGSDLRGEELVDLDEPDQIQGCRACGFRLVRGLGRIDSGSFG
jgi:hypothetical protein